MQDVQELPQAPAMPVNSCRPCRDQSKFNHL